MAAKLNKKYFGNRNIGTNDDNTTGPLENSQNYGDDRIGGEGVASVTPNAEGSYTTSLPTATFSPPDLPGGVRATGIVHGHALSASTTANGNNYNYNDLLTVVGGTVISAAQFRVAATVIATAVKSAGGSGYADGDLLTFSTGFSPSLILRVNRPGGGTGSPDNFTITQAGRRTSANPTNPVSYDSRTGSGSGCTVNMTFGVYSFSTVVFQGDYTVMPSNPASFTGGSGTGAAATITFGVSGFEITEKGSGYTSPTDAAITFSGGAASYTPVLTTDNGIPYSAGNQENALIPYAYVTGGSRQIADIIRQVGARRYKVKTATGVMTCALKTTGAASAAGEMDLTATDSSGKTYYVKKLTAHKATLVRYGTAGHEFATDTAVQWTFDAPTLNTTVQIANA